MQNLATLNILLFCFYVKMDVRSLVQRREFRLLLQDSTILTTTSLSMHWISLMVIEYYVSRSYCAM